MEETLNALVQDPTKVFSRDIDPRCFDRHIKALLDGIAAYSKLDEVYIEGLDAAQIFGQSKIIVENAAQVVMEKLEELQVEQHSASDASDAEETRYESLEEYETEHIDKNDSDESQSQDEEVDDEELSEAGVSEDNGTLEEDVEEPENETKTEFNKDAFGLNDEFFDIDDFNKQVLALEDNNGARENEEEDFDYFKEVEDSDDEIDYFDDFYEKPSQPQKKQLLDDNDSEDEGAGIEDEGDFDLNEEDYSNAINNAQEDFYEKSTFEKQQERIQKEINQLEDELVAEKKWTMKGEANAKQRPEDALLNDKEDFDFERVTKPVPVITEEVTQTIEDVIRKRIKDEEFDDLPKRFLNEVVKQRKEREEVSETKSKKSLAEIYEDKQLGVEDNEKEEKLNQDHQEILELFNKVNYKLDSLTSFNFVPKPAESRVVEIKNNTIQMEDSQPEFVSNENRLAPQEIYQRQKEGDEVLLKSGLSYSKDELSRDEKQRLRRAMKRKKSKQFKSKTEKKPKKDNVVDTLAKAKNLTVIDKKGQKTDVMGNVKKHTQVTSASLRL